MPTVTPFIPEQITVHLGPPGSDAANVTVSFSDYVKNVASSEIYPTWDESALRANILAIVSFALNRVYTEFYRSRGYDFDITNSTAFDQFFVNGRSFFEDISELVDELFNDYLRRPGFVEPLAAKFCNGTTVTCEGLSQWGSQNLAQQGYNSDQILRSYYGNVETVLNAPIRGNTSSYPGTPLRVGSTGPNVVVLQVSLNRIAQSYPAIPKIPDVDGVFGSRTQASVEAFQRIFGLTPDGIVGPSTWYAIVRLYTAVNSLSELRSRGQQFYSIDWSPPTVLQQGSTGDKVRFLQYMLSVLSAYIPSIPPVAVDGVYGPATTSAVLAAQRRFQLPETGTVGAQTWDEIYDQYSGIENTSLRSTEIFPDSTPADVPAMAAAAPRNRSRVPMRSTRPAPVQQQNQNLPVQPYYQTTTMTQFPGFDLHMGQQDPIRQEVVR
ncbi:MAG: peptidoglycan-binding protein [Oscillospiraceae bacterium]|nr:peptidoglycan-binding protein [Oscillospiraceae bacterium]